MPINILTVEAAQQIEQEILDSLPINLPSLFNGGAMGDLIIPGPGYLWQDRAGTVPAIADGDPIRSLRGRVNGVFAAVDIDAHFYTLRIIDSQWWIQGNAQSQGFAISPDQQDWRIIVTGYADADYNSLDNIENLPYTFGEPFPGAVMNYPPLHLEEYDTQTGNSYAFSGGYPYRLKLFGLVSGPGHMPNGLRYRGLIFIGNEVPVILHQQIMDAL